MGLFTSADKKAEKEQQKLEALIKRYNLDDCCLSEEDKQFLPKISACFRGSTLIDIGTLLSGDNSDKLWNIQSFNEAMFIQNWMIIKQLSKLNENLENLINKK